MNKKRFRIMGIVMVIALIINQFAGLKLTAIASSSSKGETVYFKLPAEWLGRVDVNTGNTILPGVYVAGGTDGEHTPWVGEHMEKVSGTDDIYSYTIPGDQTLIIFNTGMQRDWQTGEVAISGGDLLYVIDSGVETKNAQGHWEPYNTTAPKVAVDSGTANFVGSKKLVLNRYNSTAGSYQINGGTEIPFENGDVIEIGKDAAELAVINVTVKASNDKGQATSYEYSYTKTKSMRVYAKNNAGWDKVYVHYWGGELGSIWPGTEMTLCEDSDDVYYADIPSKTANFKFNNGKEDGGAETQQTSNLASQDIVDGVSDCYVINYLNAGETANTGSFTSLEKALAGAPEEGKPILSVDSVSADLGAEFNVNIQLENVAKMSGYVLKIAYDASVIRPLTDQVDSSLIVNEKTPGELFVVYSSAKDKDYTTKTILATIPFKAVTTSTAQTKIKIVSADLYADETEKVDFVSTNLVYGKATIGVDKTVLAEKLTYINDLDENAYTALSYQNLLTLKENAQKVYDNIEATQDKVDAQVQALTEGIDGLVKANEDGNFVYFKNTTEWEDVYAYWWGSQTECSAFPGIKATKVNGTTDTYKVELPEDATGLNFNNGSTVDGSKEQTDSITGENLAKDNMFVPDINDSYEKNNGIRFRGTVTKYTPNTIYFLNNANWENVNVYWWGSQTECAAFPGVKTKLLEGTTDIYYAVIPEDATGMNFNNGKQPAEGGEQTSSISAIEKGKILVMDLDSKYEKNGGYRYNASFELLEDHINPGEDPTPGEDETPSEDPTPGESQTPGEDQTTEDNQKPGNGQNPGQQTPVTDSSDQSGQNIQGTTSVQETQNTSTTKPNSQNAGSVSTGDPIMIGSIILLCISAVIVVVAKRKDEKNV